MHIGILSILALLMLSSAEAQLIDRAFFRQPHSASAAERTHHIFVCELTATPNKVVWLRQTLLMDGYEILTTDHAVRNDYAEKIFFVSEENLMSKSLVIRTLEFFRFPFLFYFPYSPSVNSIGTVHIKLLRCSND